MGERLNIRKKGAVDSWLILLIVQGGQGQPSGWASIVAKNQKEVGLLPILAVLGWLIF